MLGQMQNKAASAALIRVLKDVAEHPMVRHEAAEALGSIAGLLLSSFSISEILHLSALIYTHKISKTSLLIYWLCFYDLATFQRILMFLDLIRELSN